MLTSTFTGRAFAAGLWVVTPFLALACAPEATAPNDDPTGAGAVGSSGGSAGVNGGVGGSTTGGAGGSVGGSMTGGTSGTGIGGATSGGAAPMAGTGGALPAAGMGGIAGVGGALPQAGDAGMATNGGAGTGGDASGAGSAGTGDSAGSGGSAGNGSGGGPSMTTCPESASFCADFEGAGIPMGASYQPTYQAAMWADFVAFDGTQKHGGSQALMVKPTGSNGYSYRLLSVPAPAPSFWVRLYVRSDQDLGQAEHNAFFGASTGTGDQNNGDLMEVAEQYCQVVMNLHDDVVLSVGGMAACGSGGKLLAKDTWHCMEGFFDGPNGKVQVFSDSMPVIDKTGWTALTFQTFVFGFIGFHGPSRTMWYDDVAVSTTRVGCP